MKKILFPLLFSQLVFSADDVYEIYEKKIAETENSEVDFLLKEEKFSDNARFIFSYSTAATPEDFATLNSIEAEVSVKFTNFWFTGFINKTVGEFDAFASNSDNTNTSESEGNFQRSPSTSEDYLQFGAGLSFDTHFYNRLFNTTNFYENISSHLTYTLLEEEMRKTQYSGPGVRSSISLNYRIGETSHVGFRMSYQGSSLKRSSKFSRELSSERSLSIVHGSVGAEYGIHF